ncbi:MAG: hypothetical protein L6R38_001342 [Xanthoria sp. 2 TBL-2021]|nr:MAG: hypothetical protein L6R38_001342 [Xanthoria sp. 2 TBL-2021]
MAESLEDRLRSHAKAFDSLLSLIPAKLYYGEDTTDQWQRKKQTKEEARVAKLAKLDPDNSKSAKDVLDERAENAKKRKRAEEDTGLDVEGVVSEAPIQGSKKQKKEAKKQKREDKGGKINHRSPKKANEDIDAEPKIAADSAKAQSAKAKDARRAERRKAKVERKKIKEENQKDLALQSNAVENVIVTEKPERQHVPATSQQSESEAEDPRRLDIDQIDVTGLSNLPPDFSPSTASSTTNPESPAFDQAVVPSGSSSVSSIAPPPRSDDLATKTENIEPEKDKNPKIDHTELEARLRRRIEDLRASRNADGLNGKPARSRQELIEARRQKAEQSKAHKKELRRKEKEEAARKQAEALARGSPLLSPAPASLIAPSPASEQPDANNFSFGRIAFADGQQASAQLESLIDPKYKTKGPQDPLTALKAAQNKEARIKSLDEGKQENIAEKDMWLNARKRAQGERVRDDTNLLKKTLKRKEKQKKKSEKEWGERLEGVRKAGEVKQRKREDNLAKRKEEKGKKGSKKVKTGKKKRPGFEGSMRTKAPRK